MKKTLLLALLSAGLSVSAYADMTASETSQKLNDPTSDIWAMFTAFQLNSYSGDSLEGSEWGASILIEPIMPITINDDIKLLSRPVLPVFLGQPVPGETYKSGSNTYLDTDQEFGLGNMQLPLMLSPNKESKLTWGLGPTFIIPTNTDDALGDDVWEAGVSFLSVYKPNEKFLSGALTQYWWSIDHDSEEEKKSHAQISLFNWYELGGGRSIGFAPTITYDANREGEKWNVPVGLSYAWMDKIGDIPTKFQIGAEYSIIKNDYYDSDFVLKLNIIPVIPSLL
ncbi:hypothetical protein [Vibrio maerlii]|uniref:hypothetical protein n=1 Tax=Vibrio maerlii TaxID=2231648 RepID=UPI000E3BC458|nr:hypothetical protein [Vibrio maerlii]